MRRHTALAAATVSLLLAGCSNMTDGPSGDDLTPEPGTSTSSTGGDTGDATRGQPLTAADVPNWVDIAVPDSAQPSLVQSCGEPTGVRDLQSAVRASAMTTPTDITVVTQVADYARGSARAAVLDTIAPALAKCPMTVGADQDVSVRVLPSTSADATAGAEIVVTDHATGIRHVTVYWAALADEFTVEVAASATISAVGDDPLLTFAPQVLAAAQAKARGQQVPTVPAPAIGEVLSATDAQVQQQAAVDAGNQPVTGAGDPSQLGEGEDEVVTTDQTDGALPGSSTGDAPVVRDTGIEGDSGPGVISGYVDPSTE